MKKQILENAYFKEDIEELKNYNRWLKDKTGDLEFYYSDLSLEVDDNAISEILDTISDMNYVLGGIQDIAVKLEEMEGVK